VKNHKGISPRQEAAAERALCQALLTLKTVDECRDFLRDLCTPAELQALADRWTVVGLLQAGQPYREIAKQTGVSVTTIGRVARYLGSGHGGYELASKRLAGAR
jgi:TrpR-related protein YerC/YecD